MYRRVFTFATVIFCNYSTACTITTTDEPILQNVECQGEGEGGNGGAGGSPLPCEPNTACESGGMVGFCTDDGECDVGVQKIWMMCVDYGLYAGKGASCVVDMDCPVSASPCEIPVCRTGSCGLSWYEQDTHACGAPGFTCNGSYCCGETKSPF